MKKTAFFQALIILLLLLISWGFFYFKRLPQAEQPDPEVTVENQPAAPEHPEIETDSEPVVKDAGQSIGKITNPETIPPLWDDWIQYLSGQQTPAEMHLALAAMKEALFSMEENDAMARLLELMFSRVNVSTGLAFEIGEGGSLMGAPDLQTHLADWLGQLSPTRAAGLGKIALNKAGTNLGPDLFAIHLRNFANGTPPEDPEKVAFIRQKFDQILDNPEWTGKPTHAVAESMDFAVYLQQGDLVAPLSEFISPDGSPALGHAASLAVERLFDLNPVESGVSILQTIGEGAVNPAARAGFVARLDPGNPAELEILESYVRHPGVNPEEAGTFLKHFPNLNMTLSHNLLSPKISITNMSSIDQRLDNALQAVRAWLGDPGMSHLQQSLASTEERLLRQMHGDPGP
jgi:hypothetical protein